MPIYAARTPDGKQYEINAPDVSTMLATVPHLTNALASPAEAAASTPSPDQVEGLAQATLHGGTFGLSDRAEALARDLLGYAQSARTTPTTATINGEQRQIPSEDYGNFGGNYSENLKEIQAKRDAFREAHPVEDLAANFAGAISPVRLAAKGLAAATGAASNLPIVAEALKTIASAPKVAKALKFIAGGAAAGGVAGGADAPEGGVAEGAKTGAETGAVLGAVLPPTLGGIGAVAKKANEIGERIVGPIIDPLINAYKNSKLPAEDQAAQRIAKAFSRDKVSPDQAAQTLSELGNHGVIADAGGKNVLSLMDLGMTKPGETMSLEQGLKDRQIGAGRRVASALADTLGVESTNFHGITKALHAKMQQVAADHGYDDVLNSGTVDFTPGFKSLMDNDVMRSALAHAKSEVGVDVSLGRATHAMDRAITTTGMEGEIEHLRVPQIDDRMDSMMEAEAAGQSFSQKSYDKLLALRTDLIKQVKETGDKTLTAEIPGESTLATVETVKPTLRTMDYVKRGLDAVINSDSGQNQVTGKLTQKGEKALALKRELMFRLRGSNPEYGDLLDAYAEPKAAESALNLGRQFMHEDSQVTEERLADMKPATRPYFKAGAARDVYDKIMNSTDTGAAFTQFLKHPLKVEKLQAVFGDNIKGFDSFMGQLANEAKMSQTYGAAGKNSMTAQRIAAAQDSGTPMLGDLPTSKSAIVKKAVSQALAPKDEVADQVGRYLLSKDPAEQTQLFMKLRDIGRQNAPSIAPSIAASQTAPQGLNSPQVRNALLSTLAAPEAARRQRK